MDPLVYRDARATHEPRYSGRVSFASDLWGLIASIFHDIGVYYRAARRRGLAVRRQPENRGRAVHRPIGINGGFLDPRAARAVRKPGAREIARLHALAQLTHQSSSKNPSKCLLSMTGLGAGRARPKSLPISIAG